VVDTFRPSFSTSFPGCPLFIKTFPIPAGRKDGGSLGQFDGPFFSFKGLFLFSSIVFNLAPLIVSRQQLRPASSSRSRILSPVSPSLFSFFFADGGESVFFYFSFRCAAINLSPSAPSFLLIDEPLPPFFPSQPKEGLDLFFFYAGRDISPAWPRFRLATASLLSFFLFFSTEDPSFFPFSSLVRIKRLSFRLHQRLEAMPR